MGNASVLLDWAACQLSPGAANKGAGGETAVGGAGPFSSLGGGGTGSGAGSLKAGKGVVQGSTRGVGLPVRGGGVQGGPEVEDFKASLVLPMLRSGVQVCVCVCVCICVFMCVCICVFMCVCVNLYVSVKLYVCVGAVGK